MIKYCNTIYLQFVLLSLIFQLSHATIYYVKTDGNDGNSGTSWSTAFATIQKALDVVQAGDEIWVARGIYKPTHYYDLWDYPQYYHFRLRDGVAMYGGFSGTETSPSQRTDYGVGGINETILSGDVGAVGDNNDNCFHVLYHPDNTYSLTQLTILDGFTIKDGNANTGAAPHNHGGGMFNGNLCHPVIRNCTFTNNFAYRGGAIYNGGNHSTYINCLFYANDASEWGGAMYCNQATPTLINCTITNNSSINGGGFYNYYDNTKLQNCIIWGNTAPTGEQFVCNNCAITLEYCCYGNGVYDIYYFDGSLTPMNCITSDPQFVNSSAGDFRVLGTSPCVDAGNNSYNSELYDIRGFNYPRKLNKTTGEVGTIDIGAYEYRVSNDPLPVELSTFTATVDVHNVTLRWQTATEMHNHGFEVERRSISSSEWQVIAFVKGAGTSNSPKEYSYTDSKLPAGSYEYRLKQIDVDGTFKYSGSVEVEIAVPREYALNQNYPNPFNPSTVINYAIPVDGMVTLKVYDMLGKEVATLVNEQQPTGSYEVQFEGSRLASGVYFYKLESGKFTAVKKLVLMK